MKFTIITPTLNSEKYILECLESVHGQKGNFDIEHIIVDGISTDSTLSIVNDFKVKSNACIRVVVERDKNMYDAINKGLSRMTGDIWAVLNSDDKYAHENVLESVLVMFSQNSDIGVVFGQLDVIDEDGEFIKRIFIPKFSIKDLINVEKCIFIRQPATFIRKDVFEKIGYFNDSYRFASDYDYMIRLALSTKCKFLNTPVTLFRRHENSYSVQDNDQNLESYLISSYYRDKLGLTGIGNTKISKWYNMIRYNIHNVRASNLQFIQKKLREGIFLNK